MEKLTKYSIRNQIKIINGVVICNQKVISKKFDNYFVNIAQNLLRKLGEPNNKFQDYLKDPNAHSFFPKEITRAEV